MPPLGRHRLAGCGLADDAARLPRRLRALPQLSDPVAGVAGEGARAGEAADACSSSGRGCCWSRSARSSSVSCSPCAPPLRVVIYRRLMMRIAEALARANRAQALVTGEVVGQVASQTLENLTSINEVVTMPVLRRSSAWTRTKSPPRRSGLARIRFRSFPIRTAARCSRRGIPATRARRGDVEAAEAGLDDRGNRQARRWPRQPWKSSTSRNKMSC